MIAASFAIDGGRIAQQKRRLGMVRLLGWLFDQPGGTWQQRWEASGANAAGNADWWKPMLAWARPHKSHGSVSTSSNLRVCALMLVCADVIRPSLEWLLSPQAPQNLVPLMTKLRDPDGFTELAALCDASQAGRTMKAAALRRASTILVVKGGTLHDVTVGDCLELSLAIDDRSLRANKAMSFYQLLHQMGVFGPGAPTTLRAFGTCGQLSPAQLIDRHGIVCRPVRDLLVAYLAERQPMLDHTTLRNLAFNLGGLFWRDLERHHPGIASLSLAPEVSAAWKQRMTMKTRRVIGANGEMAEVTERRANPKVLLPRSAASTSTSHSGPWRTLLAGGSGPHLVRSAYKTSHDKKRFAPASRGSTSGPGSDFLSWRYSRLGSMMNGLRRPLACRPPRPPSPVAPSRSGTGPCVAPKGAAT